MATSAGLSVLNSLRDEFISLDSGAQAKTLLELYNGVEPRHVLMEPLLVPLMLVAYIGLQPHFTWVCRKLGTTGKSVPFKLFALIHNLLLCAYSFWTTVNVWLLTYKFWNAFGMDAVYCTGGLWEEGLQFWGFLFYLSKYWELMDTMLLIIKGKKPSFLQVYHHSITIVCAYMLQASHSPMNYVFVGLNSTIHTIMYAYYALTVVGVRLAIKPVITVMQMVQFVLGSLMALPSFFMREGECSTISQKAGVGAFIVHAVVLIKLFADFYRETYTKKKKS